MAKAATTTRQRNPIYISIYEMRDKEQAHSPKCTTVSRSPRQYQGVCPEGDWIGSKTTGSKALLEMKKHAEDTRVPAQATIDPELEALASETVAEEVSEANAATGVEEEGEETGS